MNRSISRGALAAAALYFAAGSGDAAMVVIASCDEVTDGDSAGCLFKGNINENADPINVNGYKNAEAAYNAWANSFTPDKPNIVLNFLTATDAGNFGQFGSFSGANSSSGSFNLNGTKVPSGFNLEYFAVKAGNQFILYEYLGAGVSGSWTTAGLVNEKGKLRGMSHVSFFGRASVVPEPASWAMMIIGFGAIGMSMRSRRREGAALATY